MGQKFDVTEQDLDASSVLQALSNSATLGDLCQHMVKYVSLSFPNLRADAEDIVISAVESTYNSLLPKGSTQTHEIIAHAPIKNLRAFLRKAVLHKAIDFQKRKAQSHETSSLDDIDQIPIGRMNQLFNSHAEVLAVDFLRDAMSHLSEREKVVFKSHYDGFTLQEIANEQGVSVQMIHRLHQRAVDKLREAAANLLQE